MTDPSAAAQPGGLISRWLIVVLARTGLLVGVLALRQFASIIGPVLLALILVIGVHPMTGILRPLRAPQWLAVTGTVIALVAVILGLAAALALSVAQLFEEQWGQRDRDPAGGWPIRSGSPKRSDCRRPSWPRWVQHASRRRVLPQRRIGTALALH